MKELEETIDINLRVSPAIASNEKELNRAIIRKSGLRISEIEEWRIIKRSIDARQRQVMINLTIRIARRGCRIINEVKPAPYQKLTDKSPILIIVGAGPAGLFAAVRALQLGIRPIVIERGRDVDARRIDIANISRQRKINPQSNYCFGEGGAGAYSDGKLYTRSKKRGNISQVLEILVYHGASPEILVDAHPHIGSDRLPTIIRSIRESIREAGGEVNFEEKVDGLLLEDGRIIGVRTDKRELTGNGVILAIGHSARDTIRQLHTDGVKMEAKGIAVGVRLEHPQELIDKLQYHSENGRGKFLPAAEYSYVTQADGRGVYSFCMCPGGVIVPAGSQDGELVVNGMSASARAGDKSNSGMVVEIRPGDFPEYSRFNELELLEFQADLEHRFFVESGDTIIAPAQRMKDFTQNRVSKTLPSTSYAPGLQSKDFNQLFPEFIASRLRKGFLDFGKKCPGFLTNEATLIGLESRTSSPVRLPRDQESLEHIEIAGLYPAGEGAGYAGGIVSAAIDGMRCAEAFATALRL